MNSLLRLLRYAKGYRIDIVLASSYSVLNKFFDILPEVLIGIAVDTVIKRQDSFLARFGIPAVEEQLLWLGLATAVIWIFESYTEYLYEVKWRNLAQSLQHELRLDAYAHVQQLPLAFFEDKSSGQLLSILNDDINQLERFLNGGANSVIQVFTSSLLIGIIFFVLTPGVAILALLPVPFILFGAFYFQNRLAPRYAEVREKAGILNGIINNNLTGIATIKAFTAEQFELQDVRTHSDDYRQANRNAIAVAAAITPVIRVAIMAGFIATLLYGGWLTLRDELAVGAYSVLIFLTQRLLWPLTGLAELTDLYQRSLASINRVLDLLETPIVIPYEGRHFPTSAIHGRIELQNVSFAYDKKPVLSDISILIPAGTTAAFVGSTGSGKSSLVKLLLRFYETQQGRLLIDGQEIRELNLQDLRRAIGFVSQDVFLIDGTVAENIAYGSFAATEQQIVAAAKAAEAHDFIDVLPRGYQTRVGERGQKLSGGQRQRLAIARAILKNPPILILDEATSAVDNETEAAIQRSLQHITLGRTTLLIAHRLSTIRHANRIYVLEQGQIVEQGTHEELLIHNGIYAGLWRLQTGEEV